MADVKEILGAISTALDVIKTVANTPGINLLPYVNTVAGAVGAIEAAIKVGSNVAPYIVAIKDTFSGGSPPTSDQLTALDAKISELEAELQAPLPPKEEGEPD